MKKLITMLLVGLMVLGSFSAVFAEEPATPQGDTILENVKGPTRLDLLKEFNAEIHSVNAIRLERNQLHNQVIQDQDKMVDLILQAREAKNKDAIMAAKEVKQQLKAVNDEISALHEQSKAANQAFRAALKAKDKDQAHSELQNIININTSINNKIKEKIELLSSMVDILS